jgi:hypothetical protein
MRCPTEVSYDFTMIARAWGSLAGILAGFAFAAVVQTITRPTGDKERDAHVVVALIAAFIGLILATMLYAVLNGENPQALVQGRGPAEELLAGTVLGFAAMSLMYALVVMIDSRDLPKAATGARLMIGVLLPALVTLEVALGALDNIFAEIVQQTIDKRSCRQGIYNHFQVFGAWLPSLSVFVISTLAWVIRSRISAWAAALKDAIPYISVLLAVVVTATFANISQFNNEYRIAHWLLYLIVWVVGFFAALISIVTVVKPTQDSSSMVDTNTEDRELGHEIERPTNVDAGHPDGPHGSKRGPAKVDLRTDGRPE